MAIKQIAAAIAVYIKIKLQRIIKYNGKK